MTQEQAIERNRPEGWNNPYKLPSDWFIYEAGADALIKAGYRLPPEQTDKREAVIEWLAIINRCANRLPQKWEDGYCKDRECNTCLTDQFLSITEPKVLSDRRKIICLCGSTRFTNEMLVKQWELTKYGFVVLTWCALPDWYFEGDDKAHVGDQEGVKEIVDEVHMRKIDLADEVLIINIGGYIGESTNNEIKYAESLGKPVKYLESQATVDKRAGEEK